MTNEEKARCISLEYVEQEPVDSCNCSRYGDEEKASYDSALKMAEWKDEQFRKEVLNYIELAYSYGEDANLLEDLLKEI